MITVKGIVGEYYGIEYEVECDFQPYERMTRDYPGAEEEIIPCLPITLIRNNGEEVECWNEILFGQIENKIYDDAKRMKEEYEMERASYIMDNDYFD